MNENRESILILEADIDLKYLDGTLQGENYIADFERNSDEFIVKCKKNRYSAFVIGSNDDKGVEDSIINAISWSPNIFTPVLVVCPELSPKLIAAISGYKYELIKFPFTVEELIFRIRKMIRQKQNEESVHNTLVKYRSLFDKFPLGIVQTDQHGNFLSANDAFTTFTSMPEAELFKENFFQLCHPEDYFIERKQLDRLLRKEVTSVSYEIRLINNDGITCVCKIIVSSIWESDGEFGNFTFVLEKIN